MNCAPGLRGLLNGENSLCGRDDSTRGISRQRESAHNEHGLFQMIISWNKDMETGYNRLQLIR
jgi:hypothetical protein